MNFLVDLSLTAAFALWLAFDKTTRLLLWSALRHPLTRTVIYEDPETGRVWAEQPEE